jgi:3-oxoacyl-[acyl-carrier-protein] synthase III
MSGINATELDLIILATTTPDKIFPATATILQKAIGANCPFIHCFFFNSKDTCVAIFSVILTCTSR